ncbi:MAG: DUF5063 domain-containing protein [Paludibacteraceae bacterium]|nr:DUF5063 domain-containing protein [Paludibacteraceae bacterium]
MERVEQHPIYSNKVIEFVTVAAEFCSFMEKCEGCGTKTFMDKMTKLLPLLYLKTSLLPDLEEESEEEIQQFVTEEEYEYTQEQVRNVIGQYDEYLEVFTPDMQYSDNPILAHISEDLTDIYQDLKDMVANFQSANQQIMNDSILNCKQNFESFWGQKALNALRALHNVLYSGAELEDEDATYGMASTDADLADDEIDGF